MRLMGNEFFPAWLLGKDVLFRFTPFRIDSLLLGGLLALWLRGSHAASLLRFARIAFPVAIAVLILLMCITQYGHIFTNPYNYPPSTATFGLSAIDITAALLLLVAIQPGSIVNCVLSLKPLAWMGRISYGAYVFHEIPHTLYYNIGSMLMPAHLNQGTAAVAFVFTIILAWLSYRYFESPFLKMKDRWTVGNG
jgi:peptidoglycan/LPS O-acetylase OafA/YrhL